MAGGKQKRHGKNKAKCAKYYNEDRRTKNKLKKFIKNNIGKSWAKDKIDKAISDFKDFQYERQKKHRLTA
jgi:hypothetical protein